MQVEHDKRIDRRAVLARGAGVFAGCVARKVLAGGTGSSAYDEAAEEQIRDYLRPLLLTREDVSLWLKQQAFPFCKYDSELGYLHIDREFPEGLAGAVCQYRYDKLGARRTFAYAGEPCRINSYGNSYTSCEQVSDGETWQESLAAHIGEPVRNYGIGAYSVYQAYLHVPRPSRCTICVISSVRASYFATISICRTSSCGTHEKRREKPFRPPTLTTRDCWITVYPAAGGSSIVSMNSPRRTAGRYFMFSHMVLDRSRNPWRIIGGSIGRLSIMSTRRNCRT